MPTTQTKVNLKPLGDRVVLEAVSEEVTAGGIFIPETAREKPQQGTVLAVGPGRIREDGKREEMNVKVGDKVLFAKYGGTDIKLGGREVKILSEKDILGIIEE